MFKIFYTDYFKDESLSSEEAELMTEKEALALLNNIEQEEDNFLGITLSPALILQFMCLQEDIWIADIPDKQKSGSYTKNCSQQECLDMISAVYKQGAGWKIPESFEFIPW